MMKQQGTFETFILNSKSTVLYHFMFDVLITNHRTRREINVSVVLEEAKREKVVPTLRYFDK